MTEISIWRLYYPCTRRVQTAFSIYSFARIVRMAESRVAGKEEEEEKWKKKKNK